MKLLPRRSQAVETPVVEQVEQPVVGKGRPTPKRRDQVVQRGPVTPPKTRKEAAARQRQQTREAREARKTPAAQMTVAQRRAALKAGDPAALPRRDQGPTRQLARDYVDTHRMFSNYLLFVLVLLVISLVVPVVQIVIPVVIVVAAVECVFTGRKLTRIAVERFGKADGGPVALGWYATSRAYLPRRWRMPGPKLNLGDEF